MQSPLPDVVYSPEPGPLRPVPAQHHHPLHYRHPLGVVHPETIDGMIVNTALNSSMGYVSLTVWT